VNDITEIAALKEQVTRLQGQVDTLSRDLERAVELIDRYGETLGNHLKGVITDQGALFRRLGTVERTLSGSA
jgi:hypothetical protein